MSTRESMPINRLLEGGEWNEDSRSNVVSVLHFVAAAIPALAREGLSPQAAHGAFLILECCADAVKVAP